MTNAALLLAVLGSVAHADGNAPSIVAAPASEAPGAAANACIAAHPGPASAPPNLAAEEKSCLGNKAPAKACDGSTVITAEAAVCIARTLASEGVVVDEPVVMRLRALNSLQSRFNGEHYPGGLAWGVQYGHNIGDVFVDAHTGEPLMASCCKGRPCTIEARSSRALVRRRGDWS